MHIKSNCTESAFDTEGLDASLESGWLGFGCERGFGSFGESQFIQLLVGWQHALGYQKTIFSTALQQEYVEKMHSNENSGMAVVRWVGLEGLLVLRIKQNVTRHTYLMHLESGNYLKVTLCIKLND